MQLIERPKLKCLNTKIFVTCVSYIIHEVHVIATKEQ